VNILDENILASQRQFLRSSRVPIRQIGYDVGRKGMKDDEIIPLLHSLRRPTFFTRDLGFYERNLCHPQYCLVCMAVGQYEAAAFARRLLRHPELDTQARRMGTVIRVSRGGLRVRRLHAEQEVILPWSD
jgi:hypothetical protein